MLDSILGGGLISEQSAIVFSNVFIFVIKLHATTFFLKVVQLSVECIFDVLDIV